jgi:hypothetical protein
MYGPSSRPVSRASVTPPIFFKIPAEKKSGIIASFTRVENHPTNGQEVALMIGIGV